MPQQKKQAEKQPKKVVVTKKEEITLPDPPKVQEGEIAMRMVYKTGQSRDIVATSMPEVVTAAQKQARTDGFNFGDGEHVVSWERVA
jgi:hypothetical protein